MKAETLEASPAYAKVQEKMLLDSGLLDETPDTIIAMKGVLAEYREKISKTKR